MTAVCLIFAYVLARLLLLNLQSVDSLVLIAHAFRFRHHPLIVSPFVYVVVQTLQGVLVAFRGHEVGVVEEEGMRLGLVGLETRQELSFEVREYPS